MMPLSRSEQMHGTSIHFAPTREPRMPTATDASRKRKAHTKSRQGCGNCKLRRVKCDETKPKCQKCISFRVACDYSAQSSELHFSGVGSFQVAIPQAAALPTPPESSDSVEDLINGLLDTPLYLHVDDVTLGSDFCYITKAHVDLLWKFRNRTILSIGTADSVGIYQKVMTESAANFSFALHAALRFTLMHDRYLYDPLGTKPSSAEAFHGYHAAAFFGNRLTAPLEEEVKDAMWATAAILGASAFASIEATKAEEAWPLQIPGFCDLDWLKMSEGKKEVWKLSNPLRVTSAFRPAIEIEQNRKDDGNRRLCDPELDRLFSFVIKLYNMDRTQREGVTKCPYHAAASILERLVPIEPSHSTIMWFLSFIGHMEPDYANLVKAKDPAALLLLSWWYAKLIPYDAWWLRRRAQFECQAICIYLDRLLPEDHEILQLLDFPKSRCGLDRPNQQRPS